MWGTNMTPTILPLRVQIDKRHYHPSFNVLTGITLPENNITKKFQNPNFVNKHNPFVHSNYLSSHPSEGIKPPPPPQQKQCEEAPNTAMGYTGMKKRTQRNRKRNKTTRKKMCDKETPQSSSPVNIIQVCKRSVTFTISPPNISYRERQPSLCESEDSLVIVFENDSDEQNDSDTCDIPLAELSQSSDEDLDVITPPKNANIKKVHFATENSLCVVHPMIHWSYAYQAARKGPWEEYARDRERFGQRISHISTVLGPILQKSHRDVIYGERFQE